MAYFTRGQQVEMNFVLSLGLLIGCLSIDSISD